MQDIFNRNCRRNNDDDDEVIGEIEDVSSEDTEDEYSYDYYDNYSDYFGSETDDCNNLDNFNGTIFEENQRILYKGLPHDTYCDMIDKLNTQCFEQSLLEIWMYNDDIINNLSSEEIIRAVNILDRSPYFGFKYKYSKLLGSIERNETGHIISAKAALYNFITVTTLDDITKQPTFGDDRQIYHDEENIKWQDEGIKIALDHNSNSSDTGIFCHLFSIKKHSNTKK